LIWVSFGVVAGEVSIENAVFSKTGNSWHVDVTLKHADSGWKHYADAWRVVLPNGDVAGTRTLFHPHVDEQPFTRSLGSVAIPAATHKVFVEAHDKVHGWSKQRLEVDLSKRSGKGFQVNP